MGECNLSVKEVSQLLRKIKGENCSPISYSVKNLGESPVGFLGNHFILSLEYCNDNSRNDIKILKLFMKTTPSNTSHAEYVEAIGAFRKEVLLFKTVIPELQAATSFLLYPWAPKCHLAKDNVLVFDDLMQKDYCLAKQEKLFDLEHCEAVIKTLADFHSASIIFESKLPFGSGKINKLYPEAVKEVCYVVEEGQARYQWLKSTTNGCVHLCKKMGREVESMLLPKIIEDTVSRVEPSSKWCNVLSHGDLWGNNFMFNYDKDGNVNHCIVVDYQLARYAPCALDLMCCLHHVASQELRRSHLKDLIRVYYQRMKTVLKEVDLDIQNIMSLQELEKGCAQYRQLGLVEACLFGTIVLIPSRLAAEVLADPERCLELAIGDRSAIVERAFEEDSFYRSRMSGLIEELLDLALLPMHT